MPGRSLGLDRGDGFLDGVYEADGHSQKMATEPRYKPEGCC